jgi:hypothetical protein
LCVLPVGQLQVLLVLEQLQELLQELLLLELLRGLLPREEESLGDGRHVQAVLVPYVVVAS